MCLTYTMIWIKMWGGEGVNCKGIWKRSSAGGNSKCQVPREECSWSVCGKARRPMSLNGEQERGRVAVDEIRPHKTLQSLTEFCNLVFWLFIIVGSQAFSRFWSKKWHALISVLTESLHQLRWKWIDGEQGRQWDRGLLQSFRWDMTD